MPKPRRVLVLDLVSLDPALLRSGDAPNLKALADQGRSVEVAPPFPAVTCTSQATMTTGALPERHGIVANGWYDRARGRTEFWEQAGPLVEAPRLWDTLKQSRPGARTAALFLQQTMHTRGLDVVLSPRPLHSGHELIQWVYSKPAGLYERLVPEVGAFLLHDYWGPLAGQKSSAWIADAAARTLSEYRPDLGFVYLPHLDYDRLRFGPSSPQAREAVRALDALVGRLLDGLRKSGALEDTTVIATGEYAFYDVRRPVHLNRALREAGLLAVRTIQGKEHLDLELSAAFAVPDHQVAHVYVNDPARLDEVRAVLRAQPGVAEVLDDKGKQALGLDHPRAGDLVAYAEPDAWFTYYHWLHDERAPPNARHVDVHGKPGFDPVELFVEPGTRHIPLDAGLVRGSHGRPCLDARDRVSVVVGPGGADAQALAGMAALQDVPRLVSELLGVPPA